MKLTHVSAVLLLLVSSASAGTIHLTGGSIDYPDVVIGDGFVHLIGDRGYTFDGGALLSPLGASACNLCAPGTQISVSASASGNDLPGNATLDGVSYSGIGDPNSPESMSFQIAGQLVVPPLGPATTVTTPITITGIFVHRQNPVSPFNPTSEMLVGGGIATLSLTPSSFPNGTPGWHATAISYDIVGVVPIAIDVKPGSDGGPINSKSHGKILVAILSGPAFDAATVDPESLRFGSTGQEPSLVSCANATTDVNGDGFPDRICKFSTDASGFQAGDTTAVLTGNTLDGTPFSGSDAVRVMH